MYINENEFNQMREELAESIKFRYVSACGANMNYLCKMLDGLENGTNTIEDVNDFFERSEDEEERYFKDSTTMLRQIYTMDDGDIKQLYYQTFGRWHPAQDE